MAWFVLTVVLFIRTYYSVHDLPVIGNNVEGNAVVYFRIYWDVLRFYDKFRSPCIMLLNWRKRPFYLKLLLSLSGDVHLNPGPDFPCGICGDSVLDEDKAMCCDSWTIDIIL